jgi:molecular chaperone DnaK
VTSGDAICGGQDIDSALSVLIFQKLKDSKIDIRAIGEPILRRVAKIYKEILSSELDVNIDFDNFDFLKYGVKQGSIPAINLARYELEFSIQDLLQKLNKLINSAVKKWREEVSNLKFNFISEINEVVLVGGSSKIPVVQATIRESLVSMGELTWKTNEFCTAVNPEHAVAEGLAIRGAVEMGYEIDGLKSILMMVRFLLRYSFFSIIMFYYICWCRTLFRIIWGY